ncbi:MAG: 5'-nucleotidase C-terminal domain-containing protein [Bacteroidota bacterium]
MFQNIKFLFILILGAGLTACSFALHKTVQANVIPLKNSDYQSNIVDSIVQPYKVVLDKEMNELLGSAEVDFIPARPNSNLGNLLADAMLERGKTLVTQTFNSTSKSNIVCILNFGGMRSTLNKGNLTLGDVFKVLPFDNQLVVVKMKASSMSLIQKWLKESNGHPIAGFSLNGNDVLNAEKQTFQNEDFWIVTSDYLLNGGDKADFFSEKIEVNFTNLLLRDVFIEYLKKEKVLKNNVELRIQ